MSNNKLLRLIISLGISRVDAEVYLHLATKGPKKGQKLSIELKMSKQQLYRSLKNLRKKGLVKASSKPPAQFTAMTIEDALNSFREAKLEEVQFIREKREELLSKWQTMIKKNSET